MARRVHQPRPRSPVWAHYGQQLPRHQAPARARLRQDRQFVQEQVCPRVANVLQHWERLLPRRGTADHGREQMGRRIFLSNLSCQILILTLRLLTNIAEDLKSLSIKFCKHLRKIDLPQAVMVRPAKTTLTARQATPRLFSNLLINNNEQFIPIFYLSPSLRLN